MAPRQVFDGDCSRLFTTEELEAAVGTAVTPVPAADIFDNQGTENQRFGGLRCDWVAPEYAVYVGVLVLPAAAVSYTEDHACDIALESGHAGCALEAITNGIRISGVVTRSDRDIGLAATAQAALLAVFAEHAVGVNVAPVPLPAAGAWSFPVDCPAVVAAADFSGVPGLGASSTGDHGGGSDAFYPRAALELWSDVGPPHCFITGESVYLYFDAYGGGRWKEAEVAAGAGTAPIAVDGLDAVYSVPLGDGTFRVNVFDGPNWLQFTVNFTTNAPAIAQTLVASLDLTAAT